MSTQIYPRVAGWTASALLLAALVACGDDASSGNAGPGSSGSPSASESTSESSSPPVTPAVLAKTYVSTEVTGHDLVDDTQIHLTFDDGNLSVNAGCNTMFAPYEVTDETLTWTSDAASTMMACSDELMAQDEWLAELFTGGVGVAGDGSTLTLTSDDVTISLESTPDEDLQETFGKTWSAVGTMADGTTSRIPGVVRTPRLVVGNNGLSRLDTGCNSGRITVTADVNSITFGHPAITRRRCQEPERTIEQRMLSVLDGRSDYVVFDGSVLIVTKGDHGVVFQVR